MGDDLRFLSRLVSERAKQILRSVPNSDGHGSSLTRAVANASEQLAEDAHNIASGGPYTPPEERAKARDLQRLAHELNLLYEAISLFGDDVGRTDLPIGLLHLVDELISDLLPSGADPIVHTATSNMYSTWSIFHAMPSILDPNALATPHPVAFNLPGLDPGNAMFAPILAHEVGHTCWQRGMGQDLVARLDKPAIDAVLSAAVQSGADPQQLMEQFSGWLQELMCDALAATLTGPSFLFASVVFLPGPGAAVLGTHPYPRDRLGFTLRILDNLGWFPELEELVPDVLAWCRDLAQNPDLQGSPVETALRLAAEIAEPAMMALAEETAVNRLSADHFAAARSDLFDHLDLEIPPVTSAGLPTSAWMAISACWLREIQRRSGDGPAALPAIAADERLNRFLLKTVELSGIVRLWGSHGPVAA